MLVGILILLLFASTPQIAPPIQGLQLSSVRDMFNEIHNGHPHEAIDMMEPRGTPVHAVVPGTIRKLFLSKPGGIPCTRSMKKRSTAITMLTSTAMRRGCMNRCGWPRGM